MTKNALVNNNIYWEELLTSIEKDIIPEQSAIDLTTLSPVGKMLYELIQDAIADFPQLKRKDTNSRDFKVVFSANINERLMKMGLMLTNMRRNKTVLPHYYAFKFVFNLFRFDITKLNLILIYAKRDQIDISQYGLFIIYIAKYVLSITELSSSEKYHLLAKFLPLSEKHKQIFSSKLKDIFVMMLDEVKEKNLSTDETLSNEPEIEKRNLSSNNTEKQVITKKRILTDISIIQFLECGEKLDCFIGKNVSLCPNDDRDTLQSFKDAVVPSQVEAILNKMFDLIASVRTENTFLAKKIYYEYKFHFTLLSFDAQKIDGVFNDIANSGIKIKFDEYIISIVNNLKNNVAGLNAEEKYRLLKVLYAFSVQHIPIYSEDSLANFLETARFLKNEYELFIDEKNKINTKAISLGDSSAIFDLAKSGLEELKGKNTDTNGVYKRQREESSSKLSELITVVSGLYNEIDEKTENNKRGKKLKTSYQDSSYEKYESLGNALKH